MYETTVIELDEIEEHIIDSLNDKKFKDLSDLKPWFTALDKQQFLEEKSFDDECYSRTRLIDRPEFELVLVCWKKGQGTDVHDHPEKGCLFEVLQGTLTEKVDCNDSENFTRKWTPGNVAYINNDFGQHEVNNIDEQRAISLHLYAPGNYEVNLESKAKFSES